MRRVEDDVSMDGGIHRRECGMNESMCLNISVVSVVVYSIFVV